MPNAQLSKEGSSSKHTAEASLEYPAFTEREPTILQSSSSLVLICGAQGVCESAPRVAQQLPRRSGSRLPGAFAFLSCGLGKRLCSIRVALNVFPPRLPRIQNPTACLSWESNRSVSQSWAFGPSQECCLQTNKARREGTSVFSKQRRAGC